jgi:hypothetical protein
MLVVRKPGQAEQSESGPPFAHGVGREVEGGSDLLVGVPRCSGQHKARAEGHGLWGGGGSRQPLQCVPSWGIESNGRGYPGHTGSH